MAYDPRLQLNMTPDGRFTPPPPRMPISTRIIAGAVLLAIVAGGLAFAAFALWIALALVPVVIVAVLIAVVTIRFKIWQAAAGPRHSAAIATSPAGRSRAASASSV